MKFTIFETLTSIQKMGCLKLTYKRNNATLKVAYSLYRENQKYCTGSYRYGFNGKEKDNEVSGDGNSYDFGARIYDSRLGRWMGVDPKYRKYTDFSPFGFALGNPILILDKDGEDIFIIGKVNGKSERIKYNPGALPPKGADPFTKDAFTALNDKIKSGEGKNISVLATTTGADVAIKSGKNTGYKNGTLTWNSSEGLVSVQYSNPEKPDDKNTKLIVNLDDPATHFSPEDILEHEIAHAKHDLVDKTLSADTEADPSNAGYDDLEEEKTINETDNQNGQFRKSHGGIPYKADSVSDRAKPEIEVEVNKEDKVIYKGQEVELKDGKAVDETPKK